MTVDCFETQTECPHCGRPIEKPEENKWCDTCIRLYQRAFWDGVQRSRMLMVMQFDEL